jgi:hypothetical protein
MSKVCLNKQKLKALLSSLVKNFTNFWTFDMEQLPAFEIEITNILYNSLNEPIWPIAHVMSLIAGFNFIEEVKKVSRLSLIKEPYDLTATGKTIIWSTEQNNIVILNMLIAESLMQLEVTLKNRALPKKISQGSLNKFACGQGIDLPRKLVTGVHYKHYGLDPKIANSPKQYTITKNVSEVAKILNCSEDNVIELCFNTNLFHAYIKAAKHGISNGQASYAQKLEEIEFHIEYGNVDPTFDRPYDGLLRLMKQDRQVPKHTLKFIRDGGIIEVSDSKDVLLLPIQRSISEAIEGTNYFITIRKNLRITKEDLVFLENEIIIYLASQKPFTKYNTSVPEPLLLDKLSGYSKIGCIESDSSDYAIKASDVNINLMENNYTQLNITLATASTIDESDEAVSDEAFVRQEVDSSSLANHDIALTDSYQLSPSSLSAISSEFGAMGGHKANQHNKEAKAEAISIAKQYWVNETLTKADIVAKIEVIFGERNITNRGEPYSSDTISGWIAEVTPPSKKQGGRPKQK